MIVYDVNSLVAVMCKLLIDTTQKMIETCLVTSENTTRIVLLDNASKLVATLEKEILTQISDQLFISSLHRKILGLSAQIQILKNDELSLFVLDEVNLENLRPYCTRFGSKMSRGEWSYAHLIYWSHFADLSMSQSIRIAKELNIA